MKSIRKDEGMLLFPTYFNKMKSSEAVRLALYDLNESDFITRVAQRIYTHLNIRKYVG